VDFTIVLAEIELRFRPNSQVIAKNNISFAKMKESKTNIILPRHGLTTKNNHKSLKSKVGIALNKAISIINTYNLEINRKLYTPDG
jgi:hypothetical protein